MSNLKKAHKRGMITGLKDVTFDKNKWMKIKKKMIHNLKKMCQRQHPKSKNKKSKMFHHKHKSPMIHPNKHPRKYR